MITLLEIIARILAMCLRIFRPVWKLIHFICCSIDKCFAEILRCFGLQIEKRNNLFQNRLINKVLANKYIYFTTKLVQVFFRGNDYIGISRIYGMKEYCRSTGQKYVVIEESRSCEVCLPCFYELKEETVEYYDSPEIYIAELNNIVVSGGSSILHVGSTYLYDPLAEDKEGRLDIRGGNLIAQIDDTYFYETRKINKTINAAVFLMGFASYNYYHLTVEILSRLKYVDDRAEYEGLPILVDQDVMCVPQYEELLGMINVKQREVIVVNKDESVQVEHLVYPSYNTWMPINLKHRENLRHSDFIMAKSCLWNIRSILPETAQEQKRYIVISRKNTTNSRLKNEKQLCDLLERYGFEIIYTEKMTVAEQIECFSSAKCVVAVSGGALTNIVYCQSGTTVCCIIPEEHHFYGYSTMAYLLGLKSIFINAEIIEKTPFPAMDIFKVDIEQCERMMEKILK